MAHFSELEDRLSNMDVITDKIDALEKEIGSDHIHIFLENLLFYRNVVENIG